jgi:predicted PolB exonuclease-like 3'-5' exonuclease
MTEILVFDTETVPDIEGYAKAHNLAITDKKAIREMMGDTFPKLIYHKVVCLSVLKASWTSTGWQVDGKVTCHTGDVEERDILKSFLDLIDNNRPQLVTFNGHSFDLPVIRYRAMIHGLSSKGLGNKKYFHRYSDDHIDLCDTLSSFNYNGKATLDETCRIMGLTGKPVGIDGSKVEEYVEAGRIKEVGGYCESDVLDTYRLYLKYCHFSGLLSDANYQSSEADAKS